MLFSFETVEGGAAFPYSSPRVAWLPLTSLLCTKEPQLLQGPHGCVPSCDMAWPWERGQPGPVAREKLVGSQPVVCSEGSLGQNGVVLLEGRGINKLASQACDLHVVSQSQAPPVSKTPPESMKAVS